MKTKPLERSPAEKAFDFVALPLILNFVLLAAAVFVTSIVDSDGNLVGPPEALARMLHGAGALSLLHWFAGLRKVWLSWHDPIGKVLRFSSSAILAMQAVAIMEALGLGMFLRLATFFVH